MNFMSGGLNMQYLGLSTKEERYFYSFRNISGGIQSTFLLPVLISSPDFLDSYNYHKWLNDLATNLTEFFIKTHGSENLAQPGVKRSRETTDEKRSEKLLSKLIINDKFKSIDTKSCICEQNNYVNSKVKPKEKKRKDFRCS